VTVFSYDPADETLVRLTELAERTFADCLGTSITIVARGDAETVAASADLARRLDETQYAAGEGPCLAASRDARPQSIVDMRKETRWPEFAAAAVASGVGSSLSVPVKVGERRAGALNLYGNRPNAFDGATDTATTLAAHVGATLTNVRLHAAATTLAAQLAEARRSRPVIERAKGILMAQRRCTAEEAFALLAAASQRENVKLREVAERLVNASAGHPPPG
jgi:GAF domain-containing protein